MPIYQYTCTRCNIDLELNVKIKDRNDQPCKLCGATLIRRIAFTGSVYSNTANGGHKV